PLPLRPRFAAEGTGCATVGSSDPLPQSRISRSRKVLRPVCLMVVLIEFNAISFLCRLTDNPQFGHAQHQRFAATLFKVDNDLGTLVLSTAANNFSMTENIMFHFGPHLERILVGVVIVDLGTAG